MTAERYYVRRPTGKVFGPFDKNAIQLMLKSNKLDANAEVSRDKQTWQALADVPDFAQFARPAGTPGGTVMGMAAVTMDDLPRPVGGADLPRPVSGTDLPRPTSGAELPRPIGGSDLPRPTSPPDLPRPTSGPGLPKPGASLPTPAQSGLPRPTSSQLPAPARPSLPLPSQAGLTARQQEEEDLFGAPMSMVDEEEDLFGAPVSGTEEEDLFGSPALSEAQESPFMSNAPPAMQEEDLFGEAPSYGQADDDLFGSPPSGADSEALFGSPPRNDIEDDLFGGAQDSELQADDLFGPDDGHVEGSEALYGDDDDFLGGSQGFSFLDDGGANSPLDQPAPRDEWDNELLGGGDSHGVGAEESNWDDELLTGNAPPAQSSYSAPPQPASSGPMRIDLDDAPQQIASTGIPSQSIASTGIPAATPEAKGPTGQKDKVADSDKKRSKMVMIGLPILAVLIIAVGALAIQRFLGDDGTNTGPTVQEIKTFKLTFEELKAPNYAVVQQKIVQSKKKDIKVSEADKGKLLLAHALMVELHADAVMLKDGQALASQLAAAKSDEAKLGRGAMLIAEKKDDDGRALLEEFKDQDGPTGSFANLFLGIEASRRLATQRKLAPTEKQEEAPIKEDVPPTKEEEKEGIPEGEEGEPTDAPPEPPAVNPVKELEQEVMDAYKAAESFAPTLAMHQLGLMFEASDDLKSASERYREGLEDEKDFVTSNVALGRVLYRQGELNEAIKFLDHVNNDLVQYAHPSEKAEALHYAGQVYSARSQHKEAIDLFVKSLASDPSRSDTLRALAEEYERAQQYKDALVFFQTNKKLGQSDPDVMLGIVRAHIGLKEWPQAIAQLEMGEKKFPTDARFPYYLGELNRRRGAFFEAQKSLASAVEIDPTLLMAHAMLAQLAWRTDQDAMRGDKHIQEIVSRPDQIDARVATEVAEFYKISGNYELAKQWYNAAIKRDPNYWAARLPLARLLLEKGETKNALDLLERSRNEGVTDIKLSAYLADAYRQSGLFGKAIDEINKVIEKVPSKDVKQRAEYIFIRGRIYFDQGNYDTALEDFNQAYTLNTNFYDANFYVGRTKLAQGDTATAIKIFRSVLDYLPNNGEYRFAMGQALQKEERLTQALNEYRKVTEVDPGYGIRNPGVYITRGRLLSQLGYSRDGRKDIQEALALAPEMVEALIAMGEVDFRDQRYEEAIKNLTKALNKEPKHPGAQYKLGMSHIYLDQLRQGTQHLELAVKYDYTDPDVYRTLGYVYKQLGDRGSALRAFEAFLQESVTAELPLGTTKEVRRQVDELKGKGS